MFAMTPKFHALCKIPAASAEHLYPSLTNFVACARSLFVSAQCIEYAAVDPLESSGKNLYANIILRVKKIIVTRKIADSVLNGGLHVLSVLISF